MAMAPARQRLPADTLIEGRGEHPCVRADAARVLVSPRFEGGLAESPWLPPGRKAADDPDVALGAMQRVAERGRARAVQGSLWGARSVTKD